jgi:hypothetical protein
MKAMLYLIWANIKGILRNMKKKKGQLVLWIFLIAIFVMMLFANNEADDLVQWIPDEYLASAYAAIVILVAALTINNGIKKGSSSYRKADIQFVFPSPVSPRLILVYGFLKQLYISILVVLWFVFQSFTIRNIFGLDERGFYVFLIAVFFVVVYMPVSSMLLYSITLRKEGAKKLMQRIYLWIAIAFAGAFIGLTIYYSDPLAAAQAIVGGKAFEYVPVLGWLVVVLKAAKWGFTPWTWGAIGLLTATLGIIVWRLLAPEIPFYEEVLKQTDEKEMKIQAKRSGSSNMNMGPKKARKASIVYKGTGAKAIFYRQLLEFKKAGFLFVDRVTLIMLAIGVAGGFILQKTGIPTISVFYVAIYLNFLFAFNGKWVKELSTPFIYLVPGTPMQKLWYSTAANHIKHLLDGTAIFIPIMIITGFDPILCLGYILAYAAIGSVFIYGDVLARRMFGAMHSGTLSSMFKVFSIMILLAPPIAAFAIVSSVFSQVLLVQWLAPLGIVAYCALISFIIMLLGRKIFSNAELA